MLMLSRIADSLFWLNRYMERADGLLRILYTHYGLALDTDIMGNLTWKPVLEVFTASGEEEIRSLEGNTMHTLNKILIDGENNNSLRMIINRARENARGIQDHITKEVWEEVNQLYHAVNHPSVEEGIRSNRGIEIIETFQKHTILYSGTTEITMSRGLGWQFMNLGKLMERSMHTIALTEKQLKLMNLQDLEGGDILQWRYLLLALSGYEQHLKTYRTTNHNFNVLHQVLLNVNFTRSLFYTLNHIHTCLGIITAGNKDEDTARLLRYFGKLRSKIEFLDLESMDVAQIRSFLTEIKTGLLQFSKLLGRLFFSYS